MTKTKARSLTVAYAAMVEANSKWLDVATTDAERIQYAATREYWRDRVREIDPEFLSPAKD